MATITDNKTVVRALQIHLGLKSFESPADEDFEKTEETFQRRSLREAIDAFHSIPMSERNVAGDLVWTAICDGLDVYRVGDFPVRPEQIYVSRMAVMRFSVEELNALDAVKCLSDGEREAIDQGIDERAEGEFLRRTKSPDLMMSTISQAKQQCDVNETGGSVYEPMYQLISSWCESDTNCFETPFFESELFQECWIETNSAIPSAKIAAIFSTFFWYRKREHSGTYAVAASDAAELVRKLRDCCHRLGARGLAKLEQRAKRRFDEEQEIMDERESRLWEEWELDRQE